MSPAERRLIYFLVCDQTRQETSKKSMYIGVYGGTLIAEGSFPVFLPSLTLVACLRPGPRPEKVQVTIKVPGMDPDAIQPHELELKAKHPFDTTTFNYAFAPAVLPEEGTLTAEFKFEDGHVEVGTLEIVSRQSYDSAKR